jgi:hypothetical protein
MPTQTSYFQQDIINTARRQGELSQLYWYVEAEFPKKMLPAGIRRRQPAQWPHGCIPVLPVGTDPDTLASVMVATREEWDQHVSDKAHANAVDYCAEHFTGAVSVLAVELADAIKRAEAAEAKLAAVPRKSIEALFFQQFGESPIWFDKRWDPIAEWLGLE